VEVSPRDPDDPPTLGHEEVGAGTVGVEVQLGGVVPPAVELHDELGLQLAGRRDVPVTARLEELTHEGDAGSSPPPELVGHRPQAGYGHEARRETVLDRPLRAR
jgi:hypothetical protein